jgi:hypothetical protein
MLLHMRNLQEKLCNYYCERDVDYKLTLNSNFIFDIMTK